MDKIISDIRAELETEQDGLIALGKFMAVHPFKEVPMYALREGVGPKSPVNREEWKEFIKDKVMKHSETQPPKKRRNRKKDSSKPL